MNPNFKHIKLLTLDVDGGMYYSKNGDELKKFNTRDGMGIQLLRENEIKIAIITKENTRLVERRAKKLNVDDLFQGVKNKLVALEELRNKYDLDYSEIAYIGDDVNDIPILENVGVSMGPHDAILDAKKICNHISEKKAGQCVVRDFYEKWRR